MSLSCPICGSEELIKSTRERHVPIEFGRDVTIEETVYSCSECGMEGDFFNENDRKIDIALEEAQKQSAVMIIDELSEKSISMAFFERAMSLPSRTLARWKRGEITASGSALLKTVKTYPWILDVAERRFEPSYAMGRLAYEGTKVAVSQFAKKIFENNIDATCQVTNSDSNSFNFIVNFNVNEKEVNSQQDVIEVKSA